MSRPRRTPVALAALALLAAACSATAGVRTQEAEQATPASSTDTTTDGTPAPVDTEPTDPTESAEPTAPTDSTSTEPIDEPDATIEWREIGEQIEQAILEVPVDYDEPDGEQFQLFLVRRLANDQANKIGSLLINPGGPGFGGAEFAAGAAFVLDEQLLDSFDVVGWDPRGVGYTEPAIDCIDDYDESYAGFDITPDDETERQQIVDVAREFQEACATKNADILQHIGTNDSARDMDSIRRALGEDTISYFGFSYGSELGATWATLFPDTVRAAVLDGAADPTVGLVEGGVQQAAGFEGTLATYLADCSADRKCAFHNGGDAEGAFDELMLALDEEPIPSEPNRPDVTRSVALQGVAKAMYDDTSWPQLSTALAAAQDGDGLPLLELWDSYYNRNPDGTWPNFLEAFQTIVCMDDVERPTVEEDDATVEDYLAVAPRFAPNTTGSYFCSFYPVSESPRVDITGAGAGPIVVIGTTGDPATPLAGTRVMAETLEDGRLVVVTADQHTGYGETECGDEVVHRYLIDLQIPAEETDC